MGVGLPSSVRMASATILCALVAERNPNRKKGQRERRPAQRPGGKLDGRGDGGPGQRPPRRPARAAKAWATSKSSLLTPSLSGCSPSSPFPVLFSSLTSPLSFSCISYISATLVFPPSYPSFLIFLAFPFLLSFPFLLFFFTVSPAPPRTHQDRDSLPVHPAPPHLLTLYSSLKKAYFSRSFPDLLSPVAEKVFLRASPGHSPGRLVESWRVPTSAQSETPEPRVMGASSSSQSLEASPQPPASLGSPWKTPRLLDTPAGHGGAGMGPLARQPNLYRVHPSGSCLLHTAVLPQHSSLSLKVPWALLPRAPGHLCPASQLIPEEAMQAERNSDSLGHSIPSSSSCLLYL